ERAASVGAPGQERRECETELDGRAVGSQGHIDREQSRTQALQRGQPRRLERRVQYQDGADAYQRAAESGDPGPPRDAEPELREEDDGDGETHDHPDPYEPRRVEVLLHHDEQDVRDATD